MTLAQLSINTSSTQSHAHEASYYLNRNSWGFFTIVALTPGQPAWKQDERISYSYPLSELDERISEWSIRGKKEGKNIFISQCSFNKPCRRRSSFHSVSQIFIDLDVYNALSLHVRTMSQDSVLNHIYFVCKQNDFPPPSMIMTSGRGYYLKWFTNEVPSKALAMWEHAQQHLNSIFAHMGADLNAKDASRVLRMENTYNHKNNQTVSVLDVNYDGDEPARYYFRDLCNSLLPYTLEEVKEFNKKREEVTKEFSKNRRIITREINQRKIVLSCLEELSLAGQDKDLTVKSLHDYVCTTRGKGTIGLARCEELLKRWHNRKNKDNVISASKALFSQKNLAWTRYADIMRLAKHRYGVKGVEDGLRSPFFLYACNFYSLSEWRNLSFDFLREFNSIGDTLVPHWNENKRNQSSSDIMKRLTETQRGTVKTYGGKSYLPLLTPKNNMLIDLLKITDSEMSAVDENGEFIMKTIISKEEKARRRPIHSERRRRKNGIVSRDNYEKKRQEKKCELFSKVASLLSAGMKGKDIAIKLDISPARVSGIKKEIGK